MSGEMVKKVRWGWVDWRIRIRMQTIRMQIHSEADVGGRRGAVTEDDRREGRRVVER